MNHLSRHRLLYRWAKAREGALCMAVLVALFPLTAAFIAFGTPAGTASESFGMVVGYGVLYYALEIAVVVRWLRCARELTRRGVDRAERREWRLSRV